MIVSIFKKKKKRRSVISHRNGVSERQFSLERKYTNGIEGDKGEERAGADECSRVGEGRRGGTTVSF